MRNTDISGTLTLEESRPTAPYLRRSGVLERMIRNRLPSTWAIQVTDQRSRTGPDAVLHLRAPDGTSANVMIEIRTVLHPRDVPYLAEQFGAGPKLLVAPFLNSRTQEALRQHGISYVDATGNLRVSIDQPALFIMDRGLQSDPWREKRSIRSLKGPTAGRVIRALCDFRPPYGVRELAQRSHTAAASVSRVISFLEPEGLVARDERGRVMAVEWADLIQRWTQDYSLMKSNTMVTFLEPRGLKALIENLARPPAGEHRYAVTGSLAAHEIAAYAPAKLAVVYAENAQELAQKLHLRPSESAVNVLIAEPFDPVVFERTWRRGDLVFSALSQVFADLLTSPGRAPAEGEELLRWMRENEDEWRT